MNTDRCLGLGFFLLCVLLWFVIIPGQTEGETEAFMPRLATVGLAIPSLILLLRPTSAAQLKVQPAVFLRSTLPLLAVFLAYVLGVNYGGFYVSTAFFLPAALILFGERRKKTLLLTPVCLLGAVYLVMSAWLNFQLPSGLLF